MKMSKIISRTVFSLAMTASVMTAVKADNQYSVKFDLGNGGSYGCKISSGSELSRDDYAYNTIIASVPTVTCTNSKYYVNSWHESGIETPATVAGAVTKDVVYLPIYKVAGTMIQYNVRYVDATMAPLAEPSSFFANVGDKPVVPYLYIEGFEPRDAYNITMTLVDADNDGVADQDFVFVYVPLEGGVIPGPITYITEDGGVTYITVPGGGGGGGAVAPAGGGGGAPAVVPPAPGGGDQIIDDNTPTTGPEEIIDIDDNQTPTGGGEGQGENNGENGNGEDIIEPPTPTSNTIGTLAKIGLAAGGGILLVLLLLLLMRRKTGTE